ncbi:MAG TPA: 3-deoxy-8-phosphooctulonate synthase, partial [Rhodobacter sp.]|nr:3-deoxy-8-phosphooctulonate synthase [Rhodobacter sp.]
MKTIDCAGLKIANDKPLLVISGPCQLESLDHAEMIAGNMAMVCQAAGAQYVFKGSYDKANRSSLSGKRGLGMIAGLEILAKIRASGIPVLTDVHDAEQAQIAAQYVDIIQIPAFL